MKTITGKELDEILFEHKKWRYNPSEGYRANLQDVNLQDVNLSGADLSDANLRGANLRGANLQDANLQDADLRGAYIFAANLRGADLRGANLNSAYLFAATLRCANLSGARLISATGNMREVKNLLFDTFTVTYTSEILHIGCESHLISDWWAFDDEVISRMDSGALLWWGRYKDFIKMAIEISPAVPTGHEISNELRGLV